jgi:hypothetical protein
MAGAFLRLQIELRQRTMELLEHKALVRVNRDRRLSSLLMNVGSLSMANLFSFQDSLTIFHVKSKQFHCSLFLPATARCGMGSAGLSTSFQMTAKRARHRDPGSCFTPRNC